MVSKRLSKKVAKKGTRTKSMKKGKLLSKKVKVGSKKVKVKKASNKTKVAIGVRMKDPKLAALCMRCFHASGKKTKSCVMKPDNRKHKLNKLGRSMISGNCKTCDGRMFVFA